MKQVIAASVAIIALLVLGTAAMNHYQTQKNINKREARVAQTAAANAQAKEKASAQAERAKLVTQYNQLRVECEKGSTSASNLPKYIQTQYKVKVANCGAVLQ